MSKSERFLAKGKMIFFNSKNNVKIATFDRNWYAEDYKRYEEMAEQMLDNKYEREFTFDVYHLMSGKEFLDCVKCGGFTNYDGQICEVFVDDFVTNVGLFTEGFISGGQFYMDEDMWANLCDNYNVIVNWANR